MRIFTLLFICLACTFRAEAQVLKPVMPLDSAIERSPYKTHIRIKYDHFAATGIVIDLFSMDNMHYAGTRTNLTNRYKDTTVNMTITQTFDRRYSFTIALDSNLSTEIAHHLLATRQDTASDESLAFPTNWIINDCYTDIFEFKKGDQYQKQVLFCSSARIDSSKYQLWRLFKYTIIPNLQYLRSALRLDSVERDFGNVLKGKGGYYTYGGPGMLSTGIRHTAKSDKEGNEWYLRRIYIDSVRNTLKAFLEEKLAHGFAGKYGLNCPNDFYLHFSKRGKLMRIATESDLWKPDEVKRYEQCKKQIFAAFRKIDLSFLKPRQEFEVMLRSAGYTVDIYPESRADH